MKQNLAWVKLRDFETYVMVKEEAGMEMVREMAERGMGEEVRVKGVRERGVGERA